MKHLVALVVLFFAVAAFADDAPPLSARQALEAGEKSIHDRGLEKEIFVTSVSLAHATIMGGESYWFVKWSHPLPGNSPSEHEIGLKVRMDGSATRLVKNLGKP
jgi:hypothetical protein